MFNQSDKQLNLWVKIPLIFVVTALVIGMLIRPFVIEKPLISPHMHIEWEPLVLSNEPVKIKSKIETFLPSHSVELPDFAAIVNVQEKKRRFFNFLTPYVEAENRRLVALNQWLMSKKQQVERLEPLSDEDNEKLQLLYSSYRIKHASMSQQKALQELLKCVDAIPLELVLMQAANESAWGTSRFAKLGLNFFGKWCYSKGCGIVPKGRPIGKTYEVQAYISVSDSVQSYFKNINTNNAYSLLREIRYQLRENDVALDAKILATGLLAYSERGSHYVEEITNMINSNQRFVMVGQ